MSIVVRIVGVQLTGPVFVPRDMAALLLLLLLLALVVAGRRTLRRCIFAATHATVVDRWWRGFVSPEGWLRLGLLEVLDRCPVVERVSPSQNSSMLALGVAGETERAVYALGIDAALRVGEGEVGPVEMMPWPQR